MSSEMASTDARPRCTGVILAGGASSRFGGKPKGLERVGSLRVIDRVANALRVAADDLLLVANADDAAEWLPGVPVARDVRNERASLVGVHSALVHARAAVLVVAWDMPFVPAEMLSALRREGERTGGAAVPSGAHGLEPLCAYYPLSAAAVAERLIALGELRLSTFVEALQGGIMLGSDWVRRFGEPEVIFLNVNDEADLRRARTLEG